jgi:hypothetical protein
MIDNATKFGRSRDMKNRDIEKDEINKITAHRLCPIREKAFFTVMRQSGLTPHVIKQLKIENVERILEPDTPAPCKISIPQEKYPTFIGQEAINYLQRYLGDRARRTKLTPESLLFTIRNNPNKEINTKDVSRTFKLVVQDLAKNRKITLEIEEGKPSELRLYKLKRFYEKNARQYLTKLSDSNTAKDDELYRNLYEELAMPSLEIEPPSPMDMHRLRKQLKKIESLFPKKQEVEEPPPEYWEVSEKEIEEHEKWLKEHPEEAKPRNTTEEYPKELEELDTEFHIEYLKDRVNELEDKFRELENIIKKPKENSTKRRS